MQCDSCKVQLLNDRYTLKKMAFTGPRSKVYLCVDCCRNENSYHYYTRTRKARQLCLSEGCLKFRQSDDYQYSSGYYCDEHDLTTQHRGCSKCSSYWSPEHPTCIVCEQVETALEFRAYRSLGDPQQLGRALNRLADYELLGSYEELADLRSRADIVDHCDELNIS